MGQPGHSRLARQLTVGEGESLRDDWSTVASVLTPDGRVMFVDDGHRASHELAEARGSSTVQRQVRDGLRFAR